MKTSSKSYRTILSLISCFIIRSHAHDLVARDGSAPNITCPADGGLTYSDNGGFTYTVFCGADAGNQTAFIQQYAIDNLTDCAQSCSDYNLGQPTVPCAAGVLTSSSAQASGTKPICRLVDSTYLPGVADAAYNSVIVTGVPNPRPPIPITDIPICTADDKKSFTDSYGNTYQIRCGQDCQQFDISGADVADMAECARLCSDWNAAGQTPCLGWVYPAGDGPGHCHLKGNGYLYTGPAAGIWNTGFLQRDANVCTLDSTSTKVSLQEGGNYGITYLDVSQANATNELGNSTQSSGCECAEQCSYYNRINNGTDSRFCQGVEYMDNVVGVNCILKTI